MKVHVRAWGFGLGMTASASAGSCAPIGPFACADDDQCRDEGLAGQCSAGYCSYPDDDCSSGQRYSEHAAADLANDCVSMDGTASESTDGQTGGVASDSDDVGTGSDATGNDTVAALCGNGDLDPGEECDDGNEQDGDECSSSCLVAGGVQWELILDMPEAQSAIAHGIAPSADDMLTVVGGAGEPMTEVMFYATCSIGSTRCAAETRHGGAEGSTTAFAVARLSDGGFWVGGRERPTQDAASERAWAGRFDAGGGEPVDSHPFNLGDDDAIFGVGVDGADRLTVAGGTGDVAWIERLDAAGDLTWSQSYAGDGQVATALAVAVGEAGGAVIAGVQLDSRDRTDGWLLRLSASGGAATPIVIGAPGQDEAAYGVATLPNSDTVVVGHAGTDGWVGRYAVGAAMASWTDSSPEGGSLLAVAAAKNGDIVVVGQIGPEGERMAWVARYGADTQRQWTATHPFAGDASLHAVAFDGEGRLFAAGETDDAGTRRAVVVEMTP